MTILLGEKCNTCKFNPKICKEKTQTSFYIHNLLAIKINFTHYKKENYHCRENHNFTVSEKQNAIPELTQNRISLFKLIKLIYFIIKSKEKFVINFHN